MADTTHNLEFITGEFLQTVKNRGLDWVKTNRDSNPYLQEGLEQGLGDLPAVKEADTRYKEIMAREVLKKVESMGLNGVRRKPWDPRLPDWNLFLQYGLAHGFYDQPALDLADTMFIETMAGEIVRIVEHIGLEQVRKDEDCNKALKYGLAHGFYDQPPLDLADTRFRETKAMDALRTVEAVGMKWMRGSAFEPYLKYGLERGLFSQEDVDRAQKLYEAQKANEARLRD